MFYFSTKSRRKIVHCGNCHYHRAMRSGTIGSFETLVEAYSSGYRLCAHCDALSNEFYKEESELEKYCSENGLSIHLSKRDIWVRSSRSEWRIIYDENRNGSKLYHKNELHPGKQFYDLLNSYHDQRISYPVIQEYLVYITGHDYYRMLHPLRTALREEIPPVKGTKRYRKALAERKRKSRIEAIHNVLTMIDSLSVKQSNV